MIQREGNFFLLHTKNTTYAMNVLESGHVEHLHYGERIFLPKGRAGAAVLDAMSEKHAFVGGNCIAYSMQQESLCLEDMRLEMSSYGKGDIREPFITLEYADGNRSTDFLSQEELIRDGKEKLNTLASSYDDSASCQQLVLTLTDKNYGARLELIYSVFEECDVIVRSAKLYNDSDKNIKIRRLMSSQLDFDEKGYVFTTFNGHWAREMKRNDTVCESGLHVNSSITGTSSNRANPFVMISKQDTGEYAGECYGCNLIYSGNHYEALEVGGYGKTRFVNGINPASFGYVLEKGECFETPESVMTYSAVGYHTMSDHMHAFVREHIVRGEWKNKVRPVLLNSWEANYFSFTEHSLLKLAKAAKEVGVELFVMDDGWFGKRDNDNSSLGDWYVNKKKLPDGIKGLAEKVNALGMDLGIWVEPEMVNEDSDLYRAHPDWAVTVPGTEYSLGRNQMVLDLTREEVQEYIISQMEQVFSSGNISYVKWDMNRIFTDCYSTALPADRQDEFCHRYVMGLYRIMGKLTEEFPHILFEGCAAGGNRFDLGILCYMPQIWASDDTDAICRTQIQEGYSYGYPMSVVSAHVSSCPNHQTLRITPLETRFNVAAFGVLGYECNLCDMKEEQRSAIKEQITVYKAWREVLQFGEFCRLEKDKWLTVAPDKSKAVGMMYQVQVEPNTNYEKFRTRGLDADKVYHFTNRTLKYNVKEFGDLVNTIAPIHIKQDSLVHNMIAKFVKMDGEKEDYTVSGSVLNGCGIKLKQAFAATGYNNETRFYQDYSSRIYFMEESGAETQEDMKEDMKEDIQEDMQS